MSTSNLLIYCYLGKLASESYEKMSDCVYNIKWYKLAAGLQKYFILMIANMEIPIYYHGFGVVDLHLETFSKVSWNPFRIIWFGARNWTRLDKYCSATHYWGQHSVSVSISSICGGATALQFIYVYVFRLQGMCWSYSWSQI